MKKRQQFPGFHLDDKVSFWEGSNVRLMKTCVKCKYKGVGAI